MSSTSLIQAMEGHNGNEYPFPIMSTSDSQSSSDDAFPRVASAHTKSQKSSASSRHPLRAEHERQHYDDIPARLLSHMYPRDARDAKQLRQLLRRTSDHLVSETRRADLAEQRVVEVLDRLRTANETIMTVRAEASRANEELRLYKIQYEAAQREILRAQQVVNQLEQARDDAEAAAARARSVARQLRERSMVAQAREEGRREGYEEGYQRGQRIAYYETLPQPRPRERIMMQPTNYTDEYSEDGQPEPIYIRPSTAGRESIPRRTQTPARYSPPRTHPISSPLRNRARSVTPGRVNEGAHHAPTLPIPTITTPVNAPSPFHDVSQQVPSNNYIPFTGDGGGISPPSPQRYERPAVVEESPLPRVPEPQLLSVRSRDYAYGISRNTQPVHPPMGVGGFDSPQSRTSTAISQFELIAPPRSNSAVNERLPREEYQPTAYRPPSRSPSPVGPRPMTPVRSPSRFDRDVRSPSGPREQIEQTPNSSSSDTLGSSSRKRADSAKSSSPLERLFKKRYRNKRTPTPPGQNRQSLVPDIVVESPSTSAPSRDSSEKFTAPHLLSPEHAHRPLPVNVETLPIAVEPVQAMHFEAPEMIMPEKVQMINVDSLPPNNMPIHYEPRSSTPQAVLDLIDSNSNRQSSGSPKPLYVPAPVPSSVVYPNPPARSMTPRAPTSPPNRVASRASNRARSRSDSLATRLSPLPFGKAFPSFTPSDSSN